MRKISAHYYLRADGNWGKRPVISLDSEGIIHAIKELGDDFKEEPGLEFFSGIIIPGFVEDWRVYNLKDKLVQQQCKKALIGGTLKVSIFNDQQQDVSSVIQNKLSVHIQRKGSVEQISQNYKSAWEQINEDWNKHLENFDLAQAIINHTADVASKVGMDLNWGIIKKNANPGLLLLQNLDWTNFTLTNKSTVRILNS